MHTNLHPEQLRDVGRWERNHVSIRPHRGDSREHANTACSIRDNTGESSVLLPHRPTAPDSTELGAGATATANWIVTGTPPTT